MKDDSPEDIKALRQELAELKARNNKLQRAVTTAAMGIGFGVEPAKLLKQISEDLL